MLGSNTGTLSRYYIGGKNLKKYGKVSMKFGIHN